MDNLIFTRRQFLGALATGLAAAAVPSALLAQQGVPQQGAPQRAGTDTMTMSSATNTVMDEGRYKPVRLPAKGSAPLLTTEQRNVLEQRIHCQCGCNLDIYTCRTTDFTCPVSPHMHSDVMALVAGGYSAQEIIDAFVHVYGEKVLMEPPKRGFNLTGYFTPFAALGAGAVLVVAVIRKWRPAPDTGPAVAPLPVEATPEELARIDAAVRSDDR
ncbi:MAG TPA: cytochrome c-type biogenesis protein CcmH [Gemmatimonadaceae bacterium]|nr:cytochrome c-type biogenesis protein CcmH [Gemmatimonadaceae bacterium]